MSTESPDERWRRLLAKAGEEQDPVKVRALIEELNNLFAGQLDRIFEQDQQSRDEIHHRFSEMFLGLLISPLLY